MDIMTISLVLLSVVLIGLSVLAMSAAVFVFGILSFYRQYPEALPLPRGLEVLRQTLTDAGFCPCSSISPFFMYPDYIETGRLRVTREWWLLANFGATLVVPFCVGPEFGPAYAVLAITGLTFMSWWPFLTTAASVLWALKWSTFYVFSAVVSSLFRHDRVAQAFWQYCRTGNGNSGPRGPRPQLGP